MRDSNSKICLGNATSTLEDYLSKGHIVIAAGGNDNDIGYGTGGVTVTDKHMIKNISTDPKYWETNLPFELTNKLISAAKQQDNNAAIDSHDKRLIISLGRKDSQRKLLTKS